MNESEKKWAFWALSCAFLVDFLDMPSLYQFYRRGKRVCIILYS